jgi:hypothetical protein
LGLKKYKERRKKNQKTKKWLIGEKRKKGGVDVRV